MKASILTGLDSMMPLMTMHILCCSQVCIFPGDVKFIKGHLSGCDRKGSCLFVEIFHQIHWMVEDEDMWLPPKEWEKIFSFQKEILHSMYICRPAFDRSCPHPHFELVNMDTQSTFLHHLSWSSVACVDAESCFDYYT